MRPSIGYSAKSQWADIADLSCSASPLLPRKGIDAATNWSGRTRDRRSDRNRPCAPAPNACGPSIHAQRRPGPGPVPTQQDAWGCRRRDTESGIASRRTLDERP